MHPVILHVRWLARDVQKKLEGFDVTAESLRAAIDEVCTDERPRLRDRVAAEVLRNLDMLGRRRID